MCHDPRRPKATPGAPPETRRDDPRTRTLRTSQAAGAGLLLLGVIWALSYGPPSLRAAAALPLVLLLPGAALSRIAPLPGASESRAPSLGRRAAHALAASLAAWPLLLLWLPEAGFAWTRSGIALLVLALGMLAWWPGRGGRRSQPRPGPAPRRADLALLALFALALGLRLPRVARLAAPPWVDGVNHGLVVEAIRQAGAYPERYTPFDGIGMASYHSGFHAGAATFALLADLPTHQALLLYGEVLNAAIVFSAWLLTRALTRRRGAAVVAALVAGLLSPWPAGYTMWGRYTQLAGLLLMPALACLWLRPGSSKTKGASRTCLLRGALLLAGLSLVHYRVTVYAACLFAAWGLVHLARPLRASPSIGLLRRALQATPGAVLLAAPWFAPRLAPVFAPRVALWTGTDEGAFYDFDWSYLLGGTGTTLLGLTAVGLLWALLEGRRGPGGVQPAAEPSARRLALTLLSWVALLFTLANLKALGLPFHGFIGNQAVQIMLFLPQAVIVGWLAARAREALAARLGSARADAGARVALLGATAVGAAIFLRPLPKHTVLAEPADLAAMPTVAALVPPDATVAINPAPWGKYQYAGDDGGAWIPALTGRATMPPPQIYALADLPYIQAMNEGAEAIRAHAPRPEVLASALRARGIGYVYIGARGGVLRPDLLLESDRFRLLHRGESVTSGTWLFEVSEPHREVAP